MSWENDPILGLDTPAGTATAEPAPWERDPVLGDPTDEPSQGGGGFARFMSSLGSAAEKSQQLSDFTAPTRKANDELHRLYPDDPNLPEVERIKNRRIRELTTGTVEPTTHRPNDLVGQQVWDRQQDEAQKQLQTRIAEMGRSGLSAEQFYFSELDKLGGLDPLTRGVASGVEGAMSVIGLGLRAIPNALPGGAAASRLADTMSQSRAYTQAESEAATRREGKVGQYVEQIAAMLTQAGVTQAAGVSAVLSFGADQAQQSYAEGKKKGLQGGQLDKYALGMGSITAITTALGGKAAGKLGVPNIEKLFGGAGGRTIGKVLAGGVAEFGENLAEMAGQQVYSRWHGVADEKSWDQFANDVLDTFVVSMLGTAAGAGASTSETMGDATGINIDPVGAVKSRSPNVSSYAQKVRDFLANPSRSNAAKAGVEEIAPTETKRKRLAAKVENALTAADFKKQLEATATSPEEAAALYALTEARAKAAGESVDDYVGSRIAKVEKRVRADVLRDRDNATLGQVDDVVEAPAFKAWFGNSKITDREGRPLVVYHGTNSPTEFDVFQPRTPQDVFTLDGREVAKANSWDYGDDAKGMPNGYHYGAITDVLTFGDAGKALKYREDELRRSLERAKEDGRSTEVSAGTKRHIADLRRMVGKKLERKTEDRPTGDGSYFTPSLGYSFTRNQGSFENGRVMPVYLSIKNPKVMNASEIEGAGQAWKVEELKAQGYDGAIFSSDPKDITKDGWSGATQIVAFDPAQIKSATGNVGKFDPSNPSILAHDGKATKTRRGEIEFIDDGRAIIRAFETQSTFTLAHELGHLFRRDLGGADADYAANWAGAKNGKWNVKAEEKFARGFERYLATGEAPTPKLKSVFEKFKSWVGGVYKAIAGSRIDVNISPEMKGVFDRLFLESEQADHAAAPSSPVDATQPQPAPEAAPTQQTQPGPEQASTQGILDELAQLRQDVTGQAAPDVLAQDDSERRITPTFVANDPAAVDRLAFWGLDNPLPEADTRHWTDVREQAKAKGIPQAAESIARSIVAKPYALDDVEVAGMLERMAEMKQERAALDEAIQNADDETEARTLIAERMALSERYDILDTARKMTGTEQGRALAARKMGLDEDMEPLTLLSSARAAKGDKLTDAERAAFDKMAADYAELKKKLDVATAKFDKQQESKTGLVRKAVRRLRKQVDTSPLPKSLKALAQRLAKEHVKAGVNDRGELTDKVFSDIKAIMPDVTRRQVMDAISGYGDFRQLSKDEVSVRLRDLKGQLQQVGKLEDMASGKAPSKTGVERREPSDTERTLIKQVNEAKKAGGYVVTDPAKQLKTALDSIKTRLRNQIKDLQSQINSRVKILKERKATPEDGETVRLREERDELKKQYLDIFGKKELSDEQRIANARKILEKSISDYERRLAAGDFSPLRQPSRTPDTPELVALRKKRDDLRERYLVDNPESPAMRRAKDRLAELERHLANGTLPTTKTPAEAKAKNAELEKLKQSIKATNDALRISEPAQVARLQATVDALRDKLARGDVALPERRPAPLSPEMERLQYELHKLRVEGRKRIADLRPKSLYDKTADILNTARALVTTLDLSAVGRQGVLLSAAHPVRAFEAMGKMFVAIKSDADIHRLQQQIENDPDRPLAQRAGLFVADIDDPSLSRKEENFRSRLIEKLPVVRGVVRASERAYVAFLNHLRFSTFKAMCRSVGGIAGPTMEQAAEIAKFINIATGRGTFGRQEHTLNALSPYFFSPRFVASRFEYLTGPATLFLKPEGVRTAIAKEYAKTAVGLGIIYALWSLFADDEDKTSWDVRSSDFGKLRIGDVRIDPLGGLSQTVVLLGRMATGEQVTAGGEPKEVRSSGDLLGRFLRSKLAPIPAAALDAASMWQASIHGKEATNAMGEPITPASVVASLTMPISVRDISDFVANEGVPKGAALGIMSLFGLGVQRYGTKVVDPAKERARIHGLMKRATSNPSSPRGWQMKRKALDELRRMRQENAPAGGRQ